MALEEETAMESLAGAVARTADTIEQMGRRVERLRELLEKACDSMECGEYCPFWKGDEEPCEFLAEVRRDRG